MHNIDIGITIIMFIPYSIAVIQTNYDTEIINIININVILV